MEQTLSLQFTNEGEKTVTLNIDNPILPADPEQIEAVMDEIIARDVFISTGGVLVSKKGARVVGREVTVIELPSLA